MRLIDTNTLKLHEFFGDQIPPYAILSHTWVPEEEVNYEEWLFVQRQNPQRWGPHVREEEEVNAIKFKSGYMKIYHACEKARHDGFRWIWVDTNCIDKTSSAELSEAINSMCQWYKRSEICYAYLQDVSSGDRSGDPGERLEISREFRQSRWFARGWTLQELIMPQKLVFVSSTWATLYDKSSIADAVYAITGIPTMVLNYPNSRLKQCSISNIMSWASMRTTTRGEDAAYSLMGLFGVNLPLLYGEEHRAFERL